MDVHVGQVFKGEMLATGSEIAFAVPIGFEVAIDYSYQHEMPNIKLSSIV